MSACLQKKTGCWFYPIIYSIYIYIIRGLQIARTVSSTARLGGGTAAQPLLCLV